MKKQITTKYIVSGENRFSFIVRNFEIENEKGIQFNKDKASGYNIKIGTQPFSGRIISRKQNRCEVEVNGNFYAFSIEREETIKRTQPLLSAIEQNQTYSMRAPMPGKITEIYATEGSEVKKGEPILTLEAMKMQNQVLASCDSVVLQLKVKEGQTVLGDQELAAMQAVSVK